METKYCNKCKEIKNIDDFHKQKASRDGHHSICKECAKEYTKNYYSNNKEHYKELWEVYKKTPNCKNRGKKYYENNTEKCLLACKKWRENNLDKAKETGKLNHIKNKEKEQVQHLIWLKNHPDKIRKYSNNRYYKNKDKIDAKLNKNISKHMWEALKGNKQGRHWEKLVNYTLQDLIKHLEKRFTNGMTWDNYGKYGWHIDHIIPIYLWEFNSYNDREFKQCWCLANLQPLWAKDNLRKGNRV